MALTELVTDPDSFMAQAVSGRRLRWEIGLLLIIGGLGIPGALYAAQTIQDDIGEVGGFIRFQLIGFVIEPIIGIFVVWMTYAVATHVIAGRAFNGRGPIRRLLKGSAWALVPVGVGNLARTLGIYLAFRGVAIPADPAGTTPVEQFQSILQVGLSKPEVVIGTVVLVLTVLYSGHLLTYAVQHGKSISEADARKTAAVPVVAFALYLLWGLV